MSPFCIFRDLSIWIFCGDSNRSAHRTYWVTAEGYFASLYVFHAFSTNGSRARAHSCVRRDVRAVCMRVHESASQTSERGVFEDISRGESMGI